MQRTRHLLRSTAIVIFFFSISKLTGFGKLILMTDIFGLSNEADALTAAVQLPDLFMQMVSGGALAAALVPIYSRYLTDRSHREQNQLASTVLTLVLLVLGIMCGLCALFAPWVAQVVLVPDFSAENQALVASLLRIVVISMMIVATNATVSALLHTHQHFILPAVGDVAIDLGQIVGIFLLAPRFGIHGVAWGGVIGALFQFAVLLPGLVKRAIWLRPQLALRLSGVRDVLRLMGPRIVTIGGAQLSDVIIIRSASGLPAGSLSGFFYSLLLIGIPTSVFGWAAGTVIFPTLAEMFNQGDKTGFKRTTTNALIALATVMFPAAVGLVALGRRGVQVIFERGEFGAESTALMYSLVAIMSLRILSDVGLVVLERVYYARHNTRTVMWFSLWWLLLYIGGALLLIPRFGVMGLAWANALSFVVLTLSMYVVLRRVPNTVDESMLLRGLVRIVLACGVMVLPIMALHSAEIAPLTFIIIAITSAVLTYVIAIVLLMRKQLAELHNAWQAA